MQPNVKFGNLQCCRPLLPGTLHDARHVHSVHVVWHAHVGCHVHLIVDGDHPRLNCRVAQTHHIWLNP